MDDLILDDIYSNWSVSHQLLLIFSFVDGSFGVILIMYNNLGYIKKISGIYETIKNFQESSG
jgi:hypothetical protein